MLLLGHGANVHYHPEFRGTALHVAAYEGHEKVVKLLLGNGASIEAENHDYFKRRPLHETATGGKQSTVEFLLSAGADVNAVDKYDRTALGNAIQGKNEEVISLLS